MPDDRVLSVVLIPGVLSLKNCHLIKMTFVVSHIDAVLFHFTHCHHFRASCLCRDLQAAQANLRNLRKREM